MKTTDNKMTDILDFAEVYGERPRRKPDTIMTGRLQVWQGL